MSVKDIKKANLPIDPRSAILLLFIANVVGFMQDSLLVEFAAFTALTILLVYCGCGRQGLKWGMIFGLVLVLQYHIFPIAPPFVAASFAVLLVYIRKMLPCLMIGTIIVRKIHMRYLLLALRKWRVPQKLIIPLSVTLRYFPAIKEEITHIRDAMKLRRINGIAKIECLVVPLIISAAGTAEELAAAAVTRGIDNPVKKTSAVDIRFSFIDYISLAVGVLLIGAAFCL